DLRARGAIVVRFLGVEDPLSCVEPFDRQLELGVGEARTGFTLARAFVVLVVGLPRDVDHAIDVGRDRVERGIVEVLEKPAPELVPRQLDVGLTFSNGRRHGDILPSRIVDCGLWIYCGIDSIADQSAIRNPQSAIQSGVVDGYSYRNDCESDGAVERLGN